VLLPTPQFKECSVVNNNLERYRRWFYAAALYNLVWGSVNALFPEFVFRLLRLPPPKDPPYWQVVGMFVLVYAPGYWWAGRHPERHKHLVLIGMLGKMLGPLGFVWAARRGQITPAFGWINLTNDLIWWPAFALYLRDAARESGGWARLLAGE
jgi:hypothetical protein